MTFDTVAVHFRRVDAARTLFRHSGLPATCLRIPPDHSDSGAAARGRLLAPVGRLFPVDFVAGPHVPDPAQGMAGRAALSCARRIHLLIRPPAPLRGDFVAAEQGSVARFGLGDARRISTRLPLEFRMVEPDLLDDPPRELRIRLLPPLPGGPAPGLEVGNGVGAITARGAEDATAPAFSLQHAPFDLGVDARGR